MRHPDRTVHAASLSVRPGAYVMQGEPPGAVVPALEVRDPVSDRTATFHPATEVYGFVGLRPGPRTLQIRDPGGRWLPVDLLTDAPDRGALVAALGAGEPAPPDAGATHVDIALFPTLALPVPPGETVVWGLVTAAGEPVRHAWVQLEIGGQTWRAATAADGTYLVWLRGVPFVEGDPPLAGTLTAAAALSPGDALAEDHGTVAAGSPDFLARFTATSSVPVSVPVRRRTRADLPLP